MGTQEGHQPDVVTLVTLQGFGSGDTDLGQPRESANAQAASTLLCLTQVDPSPIHVVSKDAHVECRGGFADVSHGPTGHRAGRFGSGMIGRMADVFLSYTSRDSRAAALLAAQLRAAGISVFWDRDIRIGQSIEDVTSAAIAQAKAYILLHPGRSGSSDFIHRETQAAIARSASDGLPVLPVLLPGREPDGDVGRFRYVRVASDEDFGPVVEITRKTLDMAGHSSPSDAGLRLSFLSSLLYTDLSHAPQAAAVVLDEIAQTVGGSSEEATRQLDILREAAKWGEAHLGPRHPSVTSLKYRLTEALLRAGLYDESLALSEQALSMSDETGDQVQASLNLANALLESGRLDDAHRRYEDSLNLARRTGSESAAAIALVALGTVAQMQGDLSSALSFFTEAVRATSRLALPSARASALIGMCELTQGSDDTEQRRRYVAEALWLARTTLAGDDALAQRAAALTRAEEDEQ